MSDETNRSSRLLNSDEAAKLLAIGPNTLAIWRCRKNYNLPYVKIGRNVRYRLGDIEAFITERTVAK